MFQGDTENSIDCSYGRIEQFLQVEVGEVSYMVLAARWIEKGFQLGPQRHTLHGHFGPEIVV